MLKDMQFDLQLFAEGEEGQENPKAPEPNITVQSNGNGGMTATVEPVDPMADPENPKDAPKDAEGSKEEPKDDPKSLEDDINKQLEAEDDVKKDLETKGVDFDALAKEYENNGALSAESMDALAKAGYPESVVNAYLNGLQALNDRFTTAVKGFAGGEEGFNRLTEFLKTQPQDVINAYNATIQSGNLGQIHLMMDGLVSKMTQKYGTANPTVMGGASANAGAEGYTSMEQMTKDMSDPRYQVDPQFTRTVMQKIKNATIF